MAKLRISVLLSVMLLVFSCTTQNKKNSLISEREPSSNKCEDHSLQAGLLRQTNLNTEWKFQKIPLNLYSTENAQSSKATVILLHGFADTIQNHQHMISDLSKAGFRVMGFDYPEHGPKGSASDLASANTWTMKSVARVVSFMSNAKYIEDKSVAPLDTSKPVVLLGWSTGATLVLRIAQSPDFLKATGLQEVKAAVAITPGIPVKAAPFNTVLNKDLTECTDGLLDPNPTSPWQTGAFAGSLLTESIALKNGGIGVPALLFISDPNKDQFVDVNSSVTWAKSNKKNGVSAIQCDGMHGLEFERNIGDVVRKNTVQFISNVLSGREFLPQDLSDKCSGI